MFANWQTEKVYDWEKQKSFLKMHVAKREATYETKLSLCCVLTSV